MAKILLIDDEILIRKSLRRGLEKEGHYIEEASNGKEALKIIDREFELVITDIFMPEMDGLETLKEIKERYPEIKIIAISGYESEHNGNVPDFLKFAKAFGAIKVFKKPFQLAEVLEAVRTLLK